MASFLERAIAEGHIGKVRSALGTEVMADPTGRMGEINKALRKIENSGLTIWESHDGREFETNQEKWTKEYFSEVQSQLSSNFSRDRFEHLLKVGRKAYESELTNPRPTSITINKSKVSSNVQREAASGPGKGLMVGMVVVAALAAMIAMYVTFKD